MCWRITFLALWLPTVLFSSETTLDISSSEQSSRIDTIVAYVNYVSNFDGNQQQLTFGNLSEQQGHNADLVHMVINPTAGTFDLFTAPRFTNYLNVFQSDEPLDPLEKFALCRAYLRATRVDRSCLPISFHPEISTKHQKLLAACELLCAGGLLVSSIVSRYILKKYSEDNATHDGFSLTSSFFSGACALDGFKRLVNSYGLSLYTTSEEKIATESIFEACKRLSYQELKGLSIRSRGFVDNNTDALIIKLALARAR